MITKYICERCGFTAESPAYFRDVSVDNTVEEFDETNNIRSNYRFCDKCVNEIHDFIKNPESYYKLNNEE